MPLAPVGFSWRGFFSAQIVSISGAGQWTLCILEDAMLIQAIKQIDLRPVATVHVPRVFQHCTTIVDNGLPGRLRPSRGSFIWTATPGLFGIRFCPVDVTQMKRSQFLGTREASRVPVYDGSKLTVTAGSGSRPEGWSDTASEALQGKTLAMGVWAQMFPVETQLS